MTEDFDGDKPKQDYSSDINYHKAVESKTSLTG
jgi:hypothetical protein